MTVAAAEGGHVDYSLRSTPARSTSVHDQGQSEISGAGHRLAVLELAEMS